MRSKSERHKREWVFFINPKTDRVQYNEKCRNCIYECKQSYRAEILNCPTYAKRK
jgi:hypothetical protein